MVSKTAKKIINSIKPNLTNAPPGPTEKGSAGYDNIRDDIEKVKKVRELLVADNISGDFDLTTTGNITGDIIRIGADLGGGVYEGIIQDSFGELTMTSNTASGLKFLGVGGIQFGNTILPTNTDAYDLGSSSKEFQDLFLSGNLDLGTNTITDGTMTGDWDLGTGNLTTTGTGNFGGAAGVDQLIVKSSLLSSPIFKITNTADMELNTAGVSGGGDIRAFSKSSTDIIKDIYTATLDRGSGTGGVGLGLGYLFVLENGDGSRQDAGKFSYEWTDVTSGAEVSQFTIQTTQAGSLTDALVINGADSDFGAGDIDTTGDINLAATSKIDFGGDVELGVLGGDFEIKGSNANILFSNTDTNGNAGFVFRDNGVNVFLFSMNGTTRNLQFDSTDGGITYSMELEYATGSVNIGQDLYFKSEGSGLLFGSFYGNSLTQTFAANNTYTRVADTGCTVGELNGSTYTDAGTTLTITKAGKYKIDWALSVESHGGAADVIDGGIMIDSTNTLQAAGQNHHQVRAANSEVSLGGTAIIDCPNGTEVIGVGMGSVGNFTIHVHSVNLVITQFGGT